MGKREQPGSGVGVGVGLGVAVDLGVVIVGGAGTIRDGGSD